MGRITATGSAGELSVYVMEGEVLAARSEDDDTMLLRRLLRTGKVDKQELSALRNAAQGGRLEEVLLRKLPSEQAETLAFERMRENLGRFLMAEEPSFERMDSLLIGHLHIGHNSRQLLAELESLLELGSELSSEEGLSTTLARSGFEPEPEHDALWSLVSECRSVAWIVQKAPSEELDTLATLARMLESGVLKRIEDLTPEEEEAALMAELERAADDPDFVEEPLKERPDEEVFEEELAMFADNDFVRGGDGDGAFTKTKEELDADRIDLTHGRDDMSALGELVGDQETVNTAGVKMNFGGPRLSNDDAAKKSAVANQVMESLCLAFDTQDGPGAGMTRVQLLVDGAPSNFSVLFRNARASSKGTVPAQVLIANLRNRPATEHRRLLNNGLANLIDRAMNMGAENLEDDDILDAFLETCVGYQKRLGL
ncbi:MAG: hypothetical protein ACI9VR_001037 [Cognaticolwellia sp.]|jgi:hypothetical protein